MLDKKFFLALAVLMGTIVGAGIFAIPYVIAKSGILPGFFYFFVLGFGVLILHLVLGEIVLRTKEKYRLIGYSQKYLGSLGKIIMSIATIAGIIGSLLAYIIIGGNFLETFFHPLFNFSSFRFSIILWIFLAIMVLKGIKLIAPATIFTNVSFFLIIFIVLLSIAPQINFQNFNLVNIKNIFLPYGVIMFSLVGITAIPELTDILRTIEERKLLKKVIIFSSVISVILYIFFGFCVAGVNGNKTSEDALSGLATSFGGKIITLGTLFGIITIVDSFLILCLYLKNSLRYDYHLSKFLASAIAIFSPIIFFLKFRSFTQIIAFSGNLLGAIEGILILLIFTRARKLGNRKPEYALKIPKFLIYLLMALFLIGILVQLFHF